MDILCRVDRTGLLGADEGKPSLTRYEIPIEDPTPRLAPTAARILDAAKRVLARDGFRALTFVNIAAEAAENPALIRYHFGSKAGLISTLVDSVLYVESLDLIEKLTSVPPGDERRRALFELHQTYAKDLDGYQLFYELVPHILRDPDLRPHLSALFDWYRKLDAWALGAQPGTEHPAQLEPLALLTVALADGVALQVQVDPDLDVGPAFEIWRGLIVSYLDSAAAGTEPKS
jgi:TetR/AcrR family transcriptional regulator, regulator of biofilm formation and stress response